MNFKDYSTTIAKSAGVDEQAARKILRAFFNDVSGKLDKGQNVPLPSFGRLMQHKFPNGKNRIVMVRAGSVKAAKKPGQRSKVATKAKK